MRLTKRKTIYPKCDNQGNLTKVDCIEIKDKGLAEEKLCQLEDIEEKRLARYKDIGINGLIDLFNNLTDDDIEYIIQLAFKKRKIIYEIH